MFAARPPTPVLRDLGLTEAEVQPVAELEEAEQQMREAVATLARSRPGGGQWLAAEQADLANALAGKPVVALAKVLAGDVSRWCETVAAVNVSANQLAERFAAKGERGWR